MGASRKHTRPPASAAHVVGSLIEFAPTDDRANPGEATARLTPVVLTPTGGPAPLVEFGPEDDSAARSEGHERNRG